MSDDDLERFAVTVLADGDAPADLVGAAWRFVCLGDTGPLLELVGALAVRAA